MEIRLSCRIGKECCRIDGNTGGDLKVKIISGVFGFSGCFEIYIEISLYKCYYHK